jgi:hypothetical protein
MRRKTALAVRACGEMLDERVLLIGAIGCVDMLLSVLAVLVLRRAVDTYPTVLSVLQCAAAGMLAGAALGHLARLDSADLRAVFGAGFGVALLVNALPTWISAVGTARALIRTIRSIERSAERRNSEYILASAATTAADVPNDTISEDDDEAAAAAATQPRVGEAEKVRNLHQRQSTATLVVLLVASCAEATMSALALAQGNWRVGALALATDWSQALALSAHGARMAEVRLLTLLAVWSACMPTAYAWFTLVAAPAVDTQALANAISGVYLYVSLVDMLSAETHAGHSPVHAQTRDSDVLDVLFVSPRTQMPVLVLHHARNMRTALTMQTALLIARPLVFLLVFVAAFYL